MTQGAGTAGQTMAKPDSITIPLSTPLDAHGETVTEITLSEIELGDLDGINIVIDDAGALRINLGDLHRLVAAMARIPTSSAARLRLRDALAAKEKIADFFGISLPTGLRS